MVDRQQATSRAGRGAAAVAAGAVGLLALAVLARPADPDSEEPGRALVAAVTLPAEPGVMQPPPGRLPAPSADGAGPVVLWQGDPPAVPVSDDLPQERERPRAETEAAHYERFLALGRRHDGSLEAAADQVLGDTASVAERVAMLRALWDSGSAAAGHWFESALAAPATADPAVPDFAVRFLGDRAAREPAARAILTEHLALPPEGCDAARLARCAAALQPIPESPEP